MSRPAARPLPRRAPYRVSYSELVRQELRDLLARASARGLGRDALTAVKEIDRRLRIYPQFGQPLQDLQQRPAQLWVGTVPSLVVRYVLDEANRQVTVVVPISPLPGLGL